MRSAEVRAALAAGYLHIYRNPEPDMCKADARAAPGPSCHLETINPKPGMGNATARVALAAGYRHIDCAACYKNQALVGEGLRDFLGSGRRGELFITSKVWNDEHRPDALRRALS